VLSCYHAALKKCEKNTCPNNAEKTFYFHLWEEVIGEILFVNNELDAQFYSRMFISILYMFRAAMCPSSGE
jgi:hypothetical protein